MIPDSEIPNCPEFEVKSKMGKIFKKHILIEEYSVKIYEIDPYEVDKNELEYIFYLELMFVFINFY